MNPICDVVAERTAVGEPLAEHADHARTCERCLPVVTLAHQLGGVHRDVDPGLGFSARMTAGAQHRLGVRRRRRIAAGAGAAVAVGALAVVLVMRPGARPVPSEVATDTRPPIPERADPPPTPPDPELATLVRLADTDRSRRLSANWARIGTPLKPYRHLLRQVALEGVTP